MIWLSQTLLPAAAFALIIAIAWRLLIRAHRDPLSPEINLAHLIINRHGRTDLLACAFIAVLTVNIWAVVVCVLRQAVPDGLLGVLGALNATIGTPLTAKVVWGNRAHPKDTTEAAP